MPEVKSFLIGVEDKFVVIGSDGVFEFLTNEDIARIVIPFYKINQPEAAANAVVKAAYKRWREVSQNLKRFSKNLTILSIGGRSS